MFKIKILFWILGLVLGISLSSHAQNKNVPSTLKGVTWKIDQLYLDTNRIYNASVDSLRYFFDDNGMFTLSKVGLTGYNKQPYIFKTGNDGKPELTIFYQTIPAETYQVIKLSAHTFIFTINKMTTDGTTSKLEYRLVPE